MKVQRTLLILFVIIFPVTAVSVGCNLTARMPDVYQYDFKATNRLNSLYLEKSSDEVGEIISNFMFGKEKEFQIYIGEEKPEAIFKDREMEAMATARKYLNVLGMVGVVTGLISLVAVIVAKKNNQGEALRDALKRSGIIYGVLMIAFISICIFVGAMEQPLEAILGYVPTEKDVLPQIFTKALLTKLCVTSVAVCTVIYAGLAYILYKLTIPRKLFSRNY